MGARGFNGIDTKEQAKMQFVKSATELPHKLPVTHLIDLSNENCSCHVENKQRFAISKDNEGRFPTHM